jgi:phosphohistidine phosphatase
MAMKSLLIMRHAKSSWSDDRLADFDRPLNDRGRRDAPRMGKLLTQLDIVPDRIISSSARRASETAKLAALAASYPGEIHYTDELYLADPDAYIELARQIDSGVNSLMLVGHNPAIEELIRDLSGKDERMPTAALAVFRLPIAGWEELSLENEYELAGVWRPKELSDKSR